MELGSRLVPFEEGWECQRAVHADVVAGRRPSTLLLVEHEPVYTVGRRAHSWERPDGDVVEPGHVPVVDVDRGGKTTWHGPGQLTVYPILRLSQPIDVIRYVRALESAVIDLCALYGLRTIRVEGRSGVWVPADAEGVAAVRRRLGPDPLRADADAEVFVAKARSRRKSIGELLMDQSVISGAGNIYRAETLFRVGVSPFRAGNRISRERLRAIWEDLRPLMEYGVATGFITTVDLDDVPDPLPPDDPEAGRWYVYHRTGRPCLRCGTPVAEQEVASRRLFWCPTCQAH